ncbi:MAG: flagellar hook-associated protein FlgL [Desulfuromonadaceae bacterium]|nr:flagellar hook-associated protein FlgL [Desulfuromonadaceae bacterium]
MKVTQMSLYRTLKANLGQSSRSMNALYVQASTGKKMIDASDDPSAIGSVFSSRTAISSAERYLETMAETQDNLDILDGYLDTAGNILIRAKEIATAAINGTLSDEDYATYAAEVEQLQNALLDVANARVDGKYLFAGYAEDTQPFSGDPVVYQGTSDHKMVEVSAGQTIQTSLSGDEVFSSPVDCFAVLADLETALSNGDTTALSSSLVDLESAAEQVRGKRSWMGNINARLDDLTTLAENMKLQMEERLSAHEDADLVEVMSGISQAEQAYEAALTVTGRLSQLSILDYL